jgi:hypothetical protein
MDDAATFLAQLSDEDLDKLNELVEVKRQDLEEDDEDFL